MLLLLRRFVLCVFALAAFPADSGAFEFDLWTSGMPIREVMAVAKDRDIPILREGLISPNKGFNPDLSLKYIDTATDFYYKQNLLSESAQVDLIFTPESKFLSAVRIRWLGSGGKVGFRDKVFDLLTKKYGRYKRRERNLFFETFEWAIDKTNAVSMKSGGNQISVEYLDSAVDKQGQKEREARKGKARRDSLSRDEGKF